MYVTMLYNCIQIILLFTFWTGETINYVLEPYMDIKGLLSVMFGHIE